MVATQICPSLSLNIAYELVPSIDVSSPGSGRYVFILPVGMSITVTPSAYVPIQSLSPSTQSAWTLLEGR